MQRGLLPRRTSNRLRWRKGRGAWAGAEVELDFHGDHGEILFFLPFNSLFNGLAYTLTHGI